MPIYEIQDGVRRAKAALENGDTVIAAQVFGGGHRGTMMNVPIVDLRSPKREIDASSKPSDVIRWRNVRHGARQNPRVLPPIIVTVNPNSRGIDIKDVDVV